MGDEATKRSTMIDDNENDIKRDYYVNDARVTEIPRSHLHKFIKQKANVQQHH